MHKLEHVQRVRDMTFESMILINPQIVIYRSHTCKIVDDELHIYISQNVCATAKLPLTLAVGGRKLESEFDIETVNQDVLDKRALGVVNNQIVYTNSLDLFRVKFNPMTREIEFIEINPSNPKATPSYTIIFNREEHFLIDRSMRGEYLENGISLENLTETVREIVSDSEKLCFELEKQYNIIYGMK